MVWPRNPPDADRWTFYEAIKVLKGVVFMPKLKTKKGAAKRFKLTKNGKIKRAKAFGNHILTKKSTKLKRSLRQAGYLDKVDAKVIKKLIPYA